MGNWVYTTCTHIISISVYEKLWLKDKTCFTIAPCHLSPWKKWLEGCVAFVFFFGCMFIHQNNCLIKLSCVLHVKHGIVCSPYSQPAPWGPHSATSKSQKAHFLINEIINTPPILGTLISNVSLEVVAPWLPWVRMQYLIRERGTKNKSKYIKNVSDLSSEKIFSSKTYFQFLLRVQQCLQRFVLFNLLFALCCECAWAHRLKLAR